MRFIISLFAIAALGAGCTPVSTPVTSDAVVSPGVQNQASGPAVPSATSTEPVPVAQPSATTPKSTTKKPAPTPKSVTQYITITDTAFSPQVKAIGVGDKVVWTNKSGKNQTVHSEAVVLFDSGNIPPGATYAHVFNAVGTYPYYSASHAELKGTVIVR